MVAPPPFDVGTVATASATVGVAPIALAVAIATLQAAATASCKRVVGAFAATRPHPLAGPPFVTAGVSAHAGPATGAADSLTATAIIGATTGIVVGTVVGHPSTGLLFLAADANAPAGPVAGIAGPLDAAAAAGP
jgi:hypothetical protein